MAVEITYFVHGTTTDNERGISTGGNPGELSELGRKQSIQLREQLGDRKFDVVFCSDLKRAVDSAQLIFVGLAPIIQDARLRECNYGQLNGGEAKVVEPMQEQMIHEKFSGGESYEDVKARMASFLQFLKVNYDGQAIAIVAHKAPQLALDILLKQKTWQLAFAEDWRKTNSWQPGWEYVLQ